jgi:hypothetical protein
LEGPEIENPIFVSIMVTSTESEFFEVGEFASPEGFQIANVVLLFLSKL